MPGVGSALLSGTSIAGTSSNSVVTGLNNLRFARSFRDHSADAEDAAGSHRAIFRAGMLDRASIERLARTPEKNAPLLNVALAEEGAAAVLLALARSTAVGPEALAII